MKHKLLIIFSLIFLLFPENIYAGPIIERTPSISVDAFIGEFRFSLFGYTSPKALVSLEGLGIYDQTYADTNGYFEFHNRFSPQSPREACLTSQDQLGRITAPTCLPPFPTKYNTRIGPVLLPPTLSLDKENYWVDDEVKLTGQTTPNSKINLAVFTGKNDFRGLIADSHGYEDRPQPKIRRTIWGRGPKSGAYLGEAFKQLFLSFFGLVKPVEAFSFSPLEATADTKGNFSISLPSSRPESFRLFAQTSYDNGQSPESIKLNIKILPFWMIIIQLLYLLWSIIKSRLLEIIIIGELVAITIFFIRRYLHPHVVANNRSLMLRKGFPLIKE